MNNKYLLLAGLALAAATATAACAREEVPEEEQGLSIEKHGKTISITAGFEQSFTPEVKTHIKEGHKIYWSRGDNAIYVFDSKQVKNQFTCSNTDTGSKTRTFTGTITEGSSIEYILWTGKNADQIDSTAIFQTPGGPLGNESISEGGNGYVEWDYTKSIDYGLKDVFRGSTLAVPATQIIGTTNTFAFHSNIAIMKKGDKAFRSVCGFIRFTIPEDIQSVKFHANEPLAGNIQIDYNGEDPIATIIGNGSQDLTVNMDFREGHYVAGTLFAILPAGTYTGFTITVTPAGGTPFTLSSSRDVVVVRGQYTDCGILPSTSPTGSDVLGQVVQVLPKNVRVGAVCVDDACRTLYVGYNGTIEAYDINIPMQPILVGSGSIKGNPRQMQVYNNRLYVTARESGTWIYSLSNLKNKGTIDLIKRFDTVEFATGLDVAGSVMFVGERQNGVEFVDVEKPAEAAHIRMIKTDESQSVFYHDGYLYSGEWSSGCVTIFKADDMNSIEQVNKIQLKGYGDGLWISDNYLFASTGHHSRNPNNGADSLGHGVEIWDLSQDKTDPAFLGRVQFDTLYKSGADWWLNRPSGNNETLFCGDVYNGLYVVDMRNKQQDSLRVIAHYALNEDPQTGGNSVNSLALGNGVVYLATTGYGLQAIKCALASPSRRNRGNALPSNNKARYNYTQSQENFVCWKPGGRGAVRQAAEWQGYLFVACGDAGLQVAQPKSGASFTVETYKPNKYHNSDLPSISFAGSVAIRGNKLYVAQGEEGVGVYRLSLGTENAENGGNGPIVRRIAQIKASLSSLDKEYNQFSYWVTLPNDKYVVSANRYGGYQFIAIGGTEDAPIYTYRGSASNDLNYMRYIPDEVCAGNRLPYVTRKGIFWVDLSRSGGISGNTEGDFIESITGSITGGVTHFRNGDALIMDSGNAYLVESGSSSISQTISLGVNGLPRWDGSSTLILTNHIEKQIHVIDISDLSSPFVKYSESTTGNPEPACFVEVQGTKKAVIPCGYQGLLIEK